MMERPEIIAWRHRYLREIRRIISNGTPIVYLDETWVNAHHTVSYKWYDESADVDKIDPKEAPSGKGKRLIILHAGYEGGFLPNCSCVFIGKTKSSDYHDEMNGRHFQEWWEEKLLPNLPEGATIVMDNAPYHTVKTATSSAPTSSTRKKDMQDWLTSRGVQWKADMLKAELYELVKKNKPAAQYICDELAKTKGFDVLRLPPYHCIFNPIELIWAWVKGKVAKDNKTYKIADVERLTNEALAAVTPEQWKNACKHCHQLVDQFWETDGLQEQVMEDVVIQLGNDSSDSEDDPMEVEE